MDAPIIKKGHGLSPIWILPLVALCIGGWLLYSSFRDAGIECFVHFPNAEGITPGKTQVMYKGIAVGLVEQVIVDEDLQGVSLVVMMQKKTKRGLVEDTKFWIVKPEISAGRISGLETLLSGSYIAVQPGSSSRAATRFEGLVEPPPLPPDSPGLYLTLRADALYSLQKGSPVYTKNLKIGIVQGYHLAEDNSIMIELYIEPQFSHLIQVGTRFWNSSGLSFEGNFQAGFSMRMESMATLIYGGISCATPESLEATSPQAVNGMIFRLYRNYEAAEYGLPMTLQLASGGGIIERKTKVMYRGLEAGVVRQVRINNDENHTVTAEILLDPRAEAILKEGTRFWVVRPEVSLDGIRNIETIIAGPYITFLPGKGDYRDNFVVEQGPMPRPSHRSGKRFTLISPDSGSLEEGVPVFYKKMVVGEVNSITFGPDLETIHTDILVYDEYTSLVRQDTVFWNVSGIEVDASLSRLTVNMSSIKSMLAGGIAFTNPEKGASEKEAPAKDGQTFILFESITKAAKTIPGLMPPGTVIRLRSTADNTFDIGSPVLYKRIPIGEVLDFTLSDDHQAIVFDILLHEEYANLVNATTRFYNFSGFNISADLTGIEVKAGPVASIVSGGIAFITPGQGEPVRDGDSFVLHADYDAALSQDSLLLSVHLNEAGGIREKTRIMYQGIKIGSVRAVRFTPDMEGIVAEAVVDREAEKLFRETTRLRLVKPEISLSGVRHLETILTGSYIDILPGEGAPRTDFTLAAGIAGTESLTGLNIILETPRLGSLGSNSPVYYRQVQVGSVSGFALSPTAQQVWVRVNILPDYASLIHNGTKFWLVSGIRASWGLFSGFDFNSESMEAVLAGGIAFATPSGVDMGAPAVNGDHFTLHETGEKTWLDWSPEIVLNEDSTGNRQPQQPVPE